MDIQKLPKYSAHKGILMFKVALSLPSIIKPISLTECCISIIGNSKNKKTIPIFTCPYNCARHICTRDIHVQQQLDKNMSLKHNARTDGANINKYSPT